MTGRMQRVAVLGGSRFIGHAVVEALLERGCRIITVNRGISPVCYSGPVERIFADRTNPKHYAAVLAGIDADRVVDLTAYLPGETRIALDAFGGRVARFVHISTLSVYHWPLPCPASEDALLETDAFNGYGFEKAECERVIFSESTGRMPWTILRLPPVIGPRDPFSREAYLYRQVLNEAPIVVPPRPYRCQNLYVADAAGAVCDLLESPKAMGRVYNVGGASFTLEAYVEMMAEMIGKPAEMMRADTRVLAQSGADPRKIPYYFEGDLFLDTRRIREDIGFEPAWTVESALKETVKGCSGFSEQKDSGAWGLPWDNFFSSGPPTAVVDERSRS